MMSDDKSTTWSNHVRLLCKQYQLPDPLKLLQCAPMSSSAWKTIVMNKITAYHERHLREKAASNSNLQYLNVQLIGLSGRSHPILHHISETREAYKLRAHLQLVTGDFPSYELIGKQRSSDPACRLCSSPVESTQHILTESLATADVKGRLLPELLNLLSDVYPTNGLLDPHVPKSTLTQFILHQVFQLCQDWCYAITSTEHNECFFLRPNEYPNIFGLSRIWRMNVRIYSTFLCSNE